MKFLLLLSAAIATPALAQSNTSNTIGEDVVVTANRSGDAENAKEIPASLTVIDDAQLRERQTRIVSDVLRDVPGVAVSRLGGVGGLTQVRIRGSEGNHVLVLIDGIEASDPYQGEFDFGTLLADEAARIEVLRGQQSSLYGSDAIGGVIQYVTLTGAEAPGVRLRAEGGSFGTAAAGARVGGVTGALDYAASATLYRTDGVPTARNGTRDIGSTNVGATAKLTYAPSDTLKLTAVGRYSLVDALNNVSEFDSTSPNFGLIVDSPNNRFRVDNYYGLLRGELALLDGRWTNALTAQIADSRRRNFTAAGLDFGDDGRRYKGSFESAIRFGEGAVKQRVTGAVDVEREEFRTVSPSPFAFTGERHIDNVGLVGAYDLEIGERLAAGASVRHDFNTRFEDATTFRVQAGYRFGEGTRVRGAYGTGIKNPGYFELYGFSDGRFIGNPGLKPEKSRGYEFGVDQAIGGRATIGATYFRSVLDDEIFTTFAPPTFVATPDNRNTRSRQRGVEVFASARPVDQLRLDLAYTYTDAEEDGTREVRRPQHIGSTNVTVLSRDERFSGTFTARYNGRQDDAVFGLGRVSLREFVLVNLSAEYRLTGGISLFGRIDNLLDDRYEEVFSYATAGRGVFGGVKARF